MKECSLIVLFILVMGAKGLAQNKQPYILILGTAQDGGFPHAGCQKKCCSSAWKYDSLRAAVVSLALVDPTSGKWWLFEATPDIKFQLHYFRQLTKGKYQYLPDGIIITHAHIGHYAGLVELGREVMNTKAVPVYVLPKMANYLQSNGPWSQLVNLGNIAVNVLPVNKSFSLSNSIRLESYTVPHRDEYSETAGFKIFAGARSYLFIPDIDKWQKWNRSIVDEVKAVDVALLDATFYAANELPDRKMSEVPHPFVSETMELFSNQDGSTKDKIHFIHFNHTNPLLWDSLARSQVCKSGFHISKQGTKL